MIDVHLPYFLFCSYFIKIAESPDYPTFFEYCSNFNTCFFPYFMPIISLQTIAIPTKIEGKTILILHKVMCHPFSPQGG